MDKVTLTEKLGLITEHWRPKVVGEFRDRVVDVGPGEFIIVPREVEHRTVAEEEAAVLLFEPATTRNTGNVEHAAFTAPMGARL